MVTVTRQGLVCMPEGGELPSVFKDAFYFVLVSLPLEGPGEGPDCPFQWQSEVPLAGPISARPYIYFGLKHSWELAYGADFECAL